MCCECSLCFPRLHFFNFSKVRCFKGRDTSVLPSIRAIVNPCIPNWNWCPIRRSISKLGCRDNRFCLLHEWLKAAAATETRNAGRWGPSWTIHFLKWWTTRNPQETTNTKVLGFTTIACLRWQNFAGYRFTYIYIYIQYIYIYIHTHTIWFRLDQSVKKKTQINGYLLLC